MKLLDCTLRDGGYPNAWDCPHDLMNQYFEAMQAAGIDVVEFGFRTFKNQGFQGPCAYSTDNFIRTLPIPTDLSFGA